MFEKLRDCVQILDDAIYMLGKEIMDSLHIEEVASLGSLSNVSNLKLVLRKAYGTNEICDLFNAHLFITLVW